ncbi:MAG: cupin domain-containing protein [Xanthobacteraceae bacterium]
MSELNQPAPPGKFLVDPYQEWAKGEGVPIHTGAAADLLKAETKTWARFGAKGAMCHLDGRDDFLTVFLLEIAPGASAALRRHLYEEISYVLSGSGVTEFELAGRKQTIEWGPRSLFAVPMNARYRHRNTSGAQARIACVNDLRYLFSLYRNEKFIFETPVDFSERDGGTLSVPDAAALKLQESKNGIASAPLTLANGTIGADVVELAPGTYQPASRQMQGAHHFGVAGEGYTLVWEEGAQDFSRIDWRHGIVFAAPGMQFHQHFNAGAAPARYLGIEFGSLRDPMLRSRRAAYGDTTVYAAGSATVAYAEQDPRIHQLWLDTIAGKDVAPRTPAGA